MCGGWGGEGTGHLKNDYFYEVVNGIVKISSYFSSTCLGLKFRFALVFTDLL